MKTIVTLAATAALASVGLLAQTFPPPVGVSALIAGFSFNNNENEGAFYIDGAPIDVVPADYSDLTLDGRQLPGVGSESRGRLLLNGTSYSSAFNTDFLGNAFGWLGNPAVGNLALNTNINTPLRAAGGQRQGEVFNVSNPLSTYPYTPLGLAIEIAEFSTDSLFASFEINATGVRPTAVSFAYRGRDSSFSNAALNVYIATDAQGPLGSPIAQVASTSLTTNVLNVNLPGSLSDTLINDSSWFFVLEFTGPFSSTLIDNVQFIGTTVPEPATYAVAAGILALGLAAWRRRRA